MRRLSGMRTVCKDCAMPCLTVRSDRPAWSNAGRRDASAGWAIGMPIAQPALCISEHPRNRFGLPSVSPQQPWKAVPVQWRDYHD